jgi:two-component system response regulator FixJ
MERTNVATVFVIDPDPATGAMMKDLLIGSELRCEIHTTCRDFLAAHDVSRPGCVVLEQRIPDMSGLQLQRRLALSGTRQVPLVFALNDATVSTAVELLRGGAVHVLEKPLRPLELLTAVQEAIDLDRERRRAAASDEQVRDLIAALSRKDREVLELMALGKSIKAIAVQLELSVRTIEQRRQKLMAKLQLRSALELMRFSIFTRQNFRSVAADGPAGAVRPSANGHAHVYTDSAQCLRSPQLAR